MYYEHVFPKHALFNRYIKKYTASLITICSKYKEKVIQEATSSHFLSSFQLSIAESFPLTGRPAVRPPLSMANG